MRRSPSRGEHWVGLRRSPRDSDADSGTESEVGGRLSVMGEGNTLR